MQLPNNRRIFVAGATGAIGKRLCPLLIREGWSPIGTTRTTDKTEMLRAMGVQPVVLDVFEHDRLIEAVQEVQPYVVMHQLTDLPPGLAKEQMPEARVRTARLREEGTRNLVAAAEAAGAPRMIAQSISFAYAPGPQPYAEDAPLNVNDPAAGETVRAVQSLERQVLNASFEGIVLRYGKLYGPGTGFKEPPPGGPLHVDAAADAARRALGHAAAGVYNIAEEDGTVDSSKARAAFGWEPSFRLPQGV